MATGAAPVEHVIGREIAPEGGPDAEYREEPGGDFGHREAFREAVPGERAAAAVVPGDLDERRVAISIVEKVGIRHVAARFIALRVELVHAHQAIRRLVRQRTQEHRVDDGKDRRAPCDAESERDHGGGREAGLTSEQADAVTDVAAQIDEPAPRQPDRGRQRSKDLAPVPGAGAPRRARRRDVLAKLLIEIAGHLVAEAERHDGTEESARQPGRCHACLDERLRRSPDHILVCSDRAASSASTPASVTVKNRRARPPLSSARAPQVAFVLEPIERGVDRADGHGPFGALLDFAANLHAVRLGAQPCDGQQDNLFEFAQVLAAAHFVISTK